MLVLFSPNCWPGNNIPVQGDKTIEARENYHPLCQAYTVLQPVLNVPPIVMVPEVLKLPVADDEGYLRDHAVIVVRRVCRCH